jgi:UDP-N-acetyl-D-mannosaminuronic acid transferase (WecB/TagA/CpsF family)
VRVAQEPRKLWRRIFVGNLRFVGLVAVGTVRRFLRRA